MPRRHPAPLVIFMVGRIAAAITINVVFEAGRGTFHGEVQTKGSARRRSAPLVRNVMPRCWTNTAEANPYMVQFLRFFGRSHRHSRKRKPACMKRRGASAFVSPLLGRAPQAARALRRPRCGRRRPALCDALGRSHALLAQRRTVRSVSSSRQFLHMLEGRAAGNPTRGIDLWGRSQPAGKAHGSEAASGDFCGGMEGR